MKKNKQIIKCCPNFYKIINFEFLENDLITQRLISIYEDYIFNIKNYNSENLKKLDYAINKYIEDYSFQKEMKKNLINIRVKKGENVLDLIVNTIINMCDNYDMGFTRNIYFARWL